MNRPIQTGDRVAYSAKFLRAIGCQTGPMPFARGQVVVVRHYSGATLANVAWNDNDADMPCGVNVENLVRIEDMHLECIE